MIKYIKKDWFYYQIGLLPDINDIDFGEWAEYISEDEYNQWLGIWIEVNIEKTSDQNVKEKEPKTKKQKKDK